MDEQEFFLGNKEVQLSLFVWLVSHRLPILSKKVFITKRRKTITLLRLNLGLPLKVNCINTLSHSNWQCKNKGSLILCANIWTKIVFMSIRKAVDKGVFRPTPVSKSYQICQNELLTKYLIATWFFFFFIDLGVAESSIQFSSSV